MNLVESQVYDDARVASDLCTYLFDHEAAVYRRHCTRNGVIGQMEWTLR